MNNVFYKIIWSHSINIYILCILTVLLYSSKPTLCYTENNVHGYPAITMDYKMQVEPGKLDCVFQYTNPGAVFYVDFHIILGGHADTGFYVRDPNGTFVLPNGWTPKATYETENAVGGFYTICVDNQHSRFTGKRVSIYMATYEATGWDRFTAELNTTNVNTEVFIKSFSLIFQRVSQMLQYLHQSKSQEARDYSLLEENNYTIGFWSFLQCIIIVGSGTLHVYFIRQFFNQTPSSGKYNARL